MSDIYRSTIAPSCTLRTARREAAERRQDHEAIAALVALSARVPYPAADEQGAIREAVRRAIEGAR